MQHLDFLEVWQKVGSVWLCLLLCLSDLGDALHAAGVAVHSVHDPIWTVASGRPDWWAPCFARCHSTPSACRGKNSGHSKGEVGQWRGKIGRGGGTEVWGLLSHAVFKEHHIPNFSSDRLIGTTFKITWLYTPWLSVAMVKFDPWVSGWKLWGTWGLPSQGATIPASPPSYPSHPSPYSTMLC